MNDDLQELQDAVDSLSTMVEEREAIMATIEAAFPEEVQRLSELGSAIPGAREELKHLIRQAGDGEHTILGHHIRVTSRKSTKVDTVLLLARAAERDEIPELVDAGFIGYTVNAAQLERLDGVQQAIYGKFIEVVAGTSAVTLPSVLKT
jgi:hypothetical protein